MQKKFFFKFINNLFLNTQPRYLSNMNSHVYNYAKKLVGKMTYFLYYIAYLTISRDLIATLILINHKTWDTVKGQRRIFLSYPTCSGARAPGLAADMHFRDNVIAFIGPACAFALEPVARLAAYWNSPIITGMGDQVGRTCFPRCKYTYQHLITSPSVRFVRAINFPH